MIELQGQLTEREHLSAQLLHRARDKARRMVVLPLLLISGLLIVVFALATLGSARHAPWLAVAAIYPLTLAVDRYILFRLRARRTYRQQESLRAPYVMRIDAAGLQFNSDFVNTREPWSHFRKWAESEDVFLLYYSDVSFMIVPKRLFPLGDEVEQLRALLARRIGQQPNNEMEPTGARHSRARRRGTAAVQPRK